jgi:hypothetical protein
VDREREKGVSREIERGGVCQERGEGKEGELSKEQ